MKCFIIEFSCISVIFMHVMRLLKIFVFYNWIPTIFCFIIVCRKNLLYPRLNKSCTKCNQNDKNDNNKPNSIQHVSMKSHPELKIFNFNFFFVTLWNNSTPLNFFVIAWYLTVLVIPWFATRCVTGGMSISQNLHAIAVNARAAERLYQAFTKRNDEVQKPSKFQTNSANDFALPVWEMFSK